jgi:hypothetical protein
MPKSLTAVTVVADNPGSARAHWQRLGFALPEGGAIALDSASLFILDRADGSPKSASLSFTLADAPAERRDAAAHPNGARALAALVTIEENPADHGEALGRATDQREMRATSTGIELKLENTRWQVLTPTAFAQFYGTPGPERQPIQALVFIVRDIEATRAWFASQHIAFEDRLGRLSLADRPAGLILAFEAL